MGDLAGRMPWVEGGMGKDGGGGGDYCHSFALGCAT